MNAALVVQRWLTTPLPLARVAFLRVLVYLFIPFDVLVFRPWGAAHGDLSAEWYAPLRIGRLLDLPTPTQGLVTPLLWGLLIGSLLCLTGRAPRLLGWTVAVLYLEWMLVSMSYGKVDHDRFGFCLALFVLPSVGRAGLRDRTPSESAGWALHMVQLGAVSTYFLAAIAKLRFGGWAWFNGATLTRAVIRRGTELALPLLDYPWMLRATQWFIMIMEFTSPVLLFLKPRWQYAVVTCLLGFHLMTFLTIRIVFLPHLVCLMAFLPLERLVPNRQSVAEPAERVAAPGRR